MKNFFMMACIVLAFAACKGAGNDPQSKDDPKSTIVDFLGTTVADFHGIDYSTENVKIQLEIMSNTAVDAATDYLTTIRLKQVKFAPSMPLSLDIEAANIPTVMHDGIYTFQSDSVPLTLLGGLNPDYTAKDLIGSTNLDTISLSVVFDIMMGTVRTQIPTTYAGKAIVQ